MRILITLAIVAVTGCGASNDQNGTEEPRAVDAEFKIKDWWSVDDFPEQLAQFETVFWASEDTTSLRELIRTTPLVNNTTILEIGTGTGLVSLCCLKAGARRVVATDINEAAVFNAEYNADRLEVADRFEVRQVPVENREAFGVIGEDEKFDLIISNPPWENEKPKSIDEFAFYDEGFVLLRSLLKDLDKHLTKDGKALLAYGCVDAIQTIQRIAPDYDLEVRILDDRNLDELPENFLPGMLLEVTPKR